MITFFSTRGMIRRPRFHEYFRVGWQVGCCILSTPWFVVMRRRNYR
jgi:hypothetical protein